MIRVHHPKAPGFDPVLRDGFRVAFVRAADCYGPLRELKRHMDTDEAFLLLAGTATLYTEEAGTRLSIQMENNTLYNIEQGTWHHLHLSEDALLLAVEREVVLPEHTERKTVQ